MRGPTKGAPCARSITAATSALCWLIASEPPALTWVPAGAACNH
jgi:hypothetical protein